MNPRRYLGLFLLLGAVFFLHLFLINPEIQGKEEDRVRLGGVFRMRPFSSAAELSLDPVREDAFILAAEQIFDGLVKLDKDLNVVPSLAEYWAISPDGKTYTFFLRKGVRFHHGRELTAADVKTSFDRIVDPDERSPYAGYFLGRVEGADEFAQGSAEEVAGFRAVDDHIFQIIWTRPYVSALYLLSLNCCSVLPHDQLRERRGRFFNSPSGTGPFRFDSWIRTREMAIGGVRLERNNDYFKEPPRLDWLEFSPLFTLENFLYGEIDSIPVLSEEALKTEYHIMKDGIINLVYLGISCQIPPFDRVEVRQAVSKSLDRKKILLAAYDIREAFFVANSFIPPELPGFFPSDEIPTADISQAKLLLEKTGMAQEEELQVTIFMPLPRERRKTSLYREISDQLSGLGMEFRLRYYGTLEELKTLQRPSLILFEKKLMLPDPDDIVRTFFYSDSSMNIFGFSDPAFNDLVTKAETERSYTKRITLYHEIEEFLLNHLPAVPLFRYTKRIAVHPYVRNVVIPPLGVDYIEAEKIWLDK